MLQSIRYFEVPEINFHCYLCLSCIHFVRKKDFRKGKKESEAQKSKVFPSEGENKFRLD